MTLFDKLGGIDAVTAAVEEMYVRLLADPLTAPFFEGTSMARLKQHQVKFMKIAFTQIPADMNVPAYLVDKHLKLFTDKGLNETHFDKVAECFVGACNHLGVSQELIDEALGVLGPLRGVFEKGALDHGKKAE